MSGTWSGTRFDGASGAGEIVAVGVDQDAVRIVSRERIERFRLDELAIAEPFERAPALIGLPGGATLEVADPLRSFAAALEAAGYRVPPVVRWQRRWPVALVALVLMIAALAWVYRVGLPMVAQALADALPASVERRMGANLLDVLDARTLKPSRLQDARREAIARAFAAATQRGAPGVDVRLEFRAGPPNAFALPGGVVVLFDGLVKLAGSDDELLAVLGHELGHVVHRHGTRQLVQALGVVAVASLLWGDFSAAAANVPAVIGVMSYGREFEREADDYAIAFLRANGRPPQALDDLFARLEATASWGRSGLPDFLSSHPATPERRQRAREAGRAAPVSPERAPAR